MCDGVRFVSSYVTLDSYDYIPYRPKPFIKLMFTKFSIANNCKKLNPLEFILNRC